jgi:hypothetical protein
MFQTQLYKHKHRSSLNNKNLTEEEHEFVARSANAEFLNEDAVQAPGHKKIDLDFRYHPPCVKICVLVLPQSRREYFEQGEGFQTCTVCHQ